ncbi:insulin-like peptide INSL6 [Suricata suricatta]|uniref:Insulin like 6 n=1 Tax=Suricata suricatta TaxID=37032 RepID=A0A673VE04_SURSU|nr:insulin-like peptide INSL6 [Suricata suricatta]
MPRLLGWCLLWLGLPLVRWSRELSDVSRARKLCGKHLMKEIVKLCGNVSWHFLKEETPKIPLFPQADEKIETFIPDRLESSQTTFPAWARGTNPVSTSAPEEKAVHSLEMLSLPKYRYKRANLPPDKTKELSSSQDTNQYIHEILELQKKNTNKIKTLSSVFWGNHPQRKRRGYSEKCCLRGCTNEELSIACFPYIDHKNLKKHVTSVMAEIY